MGANTRPLGWSCLKLPYFSWADAVDVGEAHKVALAQETF